MYSASHNDNARAAHPRTDDTAAFFPSYFFGVLEKMGFIGNIYTTKYVQHQARKSTANGGQIFHLNRSWIEANHLCVCCTHIDLMALFRRSKR